MGNVTFFVIFAVLDVSLAVNLCINCSFFTFYLNNDGNGNGNTTTRELMLVRSQNHSRGLVTSRYTTLHGFRTLKICASIELANHVNLKVNKDVEMM